MGTVRATVEVLDPASMIARVSVPATLQSVRSAVRNEPVLATLRRLSGKDYGYDKASWRKWWNENGRALAERQEKAHAPTTEVAADASNRKVVRAGQDKAKPKPLAKSKPGD